MADEEQATEPKKDHEPPAGAETTARWTGGAKALGYTATAKWFGELLCERAVERADVRCTSIRPCWVQDESSYERNLGPIVRDPSIRIGNYCSYVDVHDLCDAVALSIETDLPGHEVFYIASPDTIGGHALVDTVRTHYGGNGIVFKPVARDDASAISSEKARRLLGWTPTRSWRDYLDADGRSLS